MIRTLFSQLQWRDWATIVGVLFGIVSLVAYYDQRRSARNMAILTKWAGLNLDKSISEEQIQELLKQKAAMEEQITRKIPGLARNAVLKEEAQLHEKALAEHFVAWQCIQRELQTESERSGLDPQLHQAILDLILPRYARLDRRDRLRTRVTVLSIALAASSAALPFPVNTALGLIVTIPLLYAGARLFALNTEDPARAFKVLRVYFHLVYMGMALIIAIVGLFLKLYATGGASRYFPTVFIIVGVLLVVVYPFIRRAIDSFVLNTCSTEPRFRLG